MNRKRITSNGKEGEFFYVLFRRAVSVISVTQTRAHLGTKSLNGSAFGEIHLYIPLRTGANSIKDNCIYIPYLLRNVLIEYTSLGARNYEG